MPILRSTTWLSPTACLPTACLNCLDYDWKAVRSTLYSVDNIYIHKQFKQFKAVDTYYSVVCRPKAGIALEDSAIDKSRAGAKGNLEHPRIHPKSCPKKKKKKKN
ncbi:hypothetical protein BDV28DRAFT_135800 [Aspergillus coremiiformis]|uniref:Uncharacterized protein n=1 Tax=Aspergillus coremiiformis TaxID=138285 RepID=A0A5N6Z333_9EURO|nr:hypothetical protein BDV28DRAFT_135800 [Aspergillus coremiiformis]